MYLSQIRKCIFPNCRMTRPRSWTAYCQLGEWRWLRRDQGIQEIASSICLILGGLPGFGERKYIAWLKTRNIVFSTMTNIKKARYFSSFTLIISYSRHKKCQVGYGQRAFQYLSSQRPLRILDIFDQTARKSCKKSLCGWEEKRTIKVEY